MMCEGVMLYLMLVVVFSKISSKWWFFLLLGYCTPLLFVVVGVGARHEYYGVRDDDGDLSFCWLSTEKGTIFAFVAPMAAIIIINVVFLVFALVSLARSKKMKAKTAHSDGAILKQAKTILRATLILLPLLGITWLFGILTLNRNATVFAWLFTVFNSLQGAALFFFHVIRNDKVWSKIKPKLSTLRQRTIKSSVKYDLSASSSSGAPGYSSSIKPVVYKKKPKEPNFYELDPPSNTSTTKESQLSSIVVSEGEAETVLDGKVAEDGGYANPMTDRLTPEDEYIEIIHNPHAGGTQPGQA